MSRPARTLLLNGCAAPSAADIAGPDLNRDGVRDDVERELSRYGYALMEGAGRDIVTLTVNTDARARTHNAMNSALSGGTFSDQADACAATSPD